ncbi:MAG: ABC transporter permease [Gemmatimonadetes bacterium]|nr:ABC transporter permease [Gemmatimonadota bacterium]
MKYFHWTPAGWALLLVITRWQKIAEFLAGPLENKMLALVALILIPVGIIIALKVTAIRKVESRRLQLAITTLMVLVGAAAFAPILAPYDPTHIIDLANAQTLAPSFAHPLGTDEFSRDLLSRMIYGARISLSIALLAITLSITLGTTLGMVAGLTGGVTDSAIMRSIDAALAIPRIVLLVVVLALWDRRDMMTIVLVLGLTGWFETARLARAEVLSLRDRNFVVAARASGVSNVKILWRHLLPNIAAPLVVTATLGVGQLILVEAGLSYLGLGVSVPTASWGSIIRDGRELLFQAPWIVTIPGFAIATTVMVFSTIGESVREALNPR